MKDAAEVYLVELVREHLNPIGRVSVGRGGPGPGCSLDIGWPGSNG